MLPTPETATKRKEDQWTKSPAWLSLRFHGHRRPQPHFQWLLVSIHPLYSTTASALTCGERRTPQRTASPSTTSFFTSRRCFMTSVSPTYSTVTECPSRRRAGTWHGCSAWRPVGLLIGRTGQQRSSCCTCATT